jgi:hypothetical protein
MLLIRPRETSKNTEHGFVSGVVMVSLVKKKLAEPVPDKPHLWRITQAGEEALSHFP